MDTFNTLAIIKDAGIPALFIVFLIWIVRYFMSQIEIWRQETKALHDETQAVIHNHLEHATEAMTRQQHALELLTQRIEIACKVHYVFRDETLPSTEEPT